MTKQKLPDKDFVWTPELAYAVGLIVTDGHLSVDGRHIIMRSSEPELLETYKKCLGIVSCSTQETHNNGFSTKVSYRVQHGGVQLYRWLQNIGIPQKKTHLIGELNIPDSVFRDFLRGHIDGDGSITTYLDYYNTFKDPSYVYERLWVRFLSASKKHILWLQTRISEIVRLHGHVHKLKPRRETGVPLYQLKFGKKESIKLLKQIYYGKNVPCLGRKRKIAEKFIH